MLITAFELNQLISAHSSVDNNASPLHIFDCRYTLPAPAKPNEQQTQSQSNASTNLTYGRACYKQGHIPHAQFVDLDTALSSKMTHHSGRHPLPTKKTFNIQLQQWGLTPNSNVVIYDDKGGIFAARLWWMLHRWANIPNVSLLDGGFPTWQKSGLALSQQHPVIPASTHVFAFNDSEYVNMQDIQTFIQAGKRDFITDARPLSRYQGEPNTLDTAFGHIPGAVSLPCQQNINEQGFFLPLSDLKSRFESLVTLNAPDSLIHSCGSGVTACHNAFAMQLAGFDDYQIYIGSWSQWTQFTDNPIET